MLQNDLFLKKGFVNQHSMEQPIPGTEVNKKKPSYHKELNNIANVILEALL